MNREECRPDERAVTLSAVLRRRLRLLNTLVRLGRYLREEGKASLVLPAESSLHVLVALGVFLGRFEHLNSWDAVTRPGEGTRATREQRARDRDVQSHCTRPTCRLR